MTKITKYIAAATIASSALLGAGVFAAGPGHMGGIGATNGTIRTINCNTVTVTVSDSSKLKVGDSVSLFDQTQAEANRAVVGKVGTVSNGSFTVQERNGSTVTIN